MELTVLMGNRGKTTKVSIRPSGTEPKIKFYIEVKGELKSREDYDKVNELANQKIEAVKVSLGISYR